MHIGLVSLHTSPLETPGQGDAGGLNVVVREAALALEQLGHEVSIATRASLRQPAGEFALSAESNVQVVAFALGDPALTKEQLPALVDDFGDVLASHPRFSGVAVLHAHYWLSGLAALTAGRALGIPVVTTMHTVGAQKNEHRSSGSAVESDMRLAAERTLTAETAIIAGSHSELVAIHEAYGHPAGHIAPATVIHPGVDTTLFSPAPSTPLPVDHPQPLHFLTIGRVQPLKGQDLALDAFIEFSSRYPELAAGSRLTIAGEPTPGHEAYAAGLRERAAASGLDIVFLPAQSRAAAADLIRGSTLTLMPSHSETFGLVALESAACATPVIAVHTTGLREAVRHEVSGLLLTGRDAGEWAQAMAGIVNDPAALRALGRSARSFAETHDWRAHATALTAQYDGVVKAARAAKPSVV